MKNYSKYICLFLLLLGTSTYAWGAKVLQFDFSEAVTGWPTSDGGSATTKTYTLVNDYTFSLGPNVYFNTYNEDTYLMLKYTTYLGLPAISNYKLTKVEITNSSGCSTSAKVAVCTSSADSSTVSGGSTTQLSTVSTTYTFNLSGTSANTAYYLYFTKKNCQLKNITLTYTPTSACTVTFNAGTGTSTSSLTEGSAGSGIVLPTATPASDCSSEYEFWGWTTEACEDETEEPLTMYFAGNKFYPESNCTLYAVYVSDKSATLDYVAISRGAEIKSGEQYIIEAYANEEDHALKAAVKSTNYLDEKDITDDISSDIYNEDPADNTIIWTITQEASETNVSLYNASSSSYLWIKSTSPYYLALNASKQTFTIAYEDHGESYLGTFSLKNSNSKYVYYDDENDWFTSSTSSDRNLYLYRRLYSGTFNTSPVCCDKIVALSKGTETNATISSFSPSSVPTCSATDADRNVTITVAAATGYEFTSSARLSYSGDGTATYVSGPTGSGPYTFVYRLSQNANGSGTFSVESATPINYTISFDANGGTGSMDDVEKTYNTTYTLPACTFTRPTDKIFDHWAAGSTSGTSYDPGDEYTMGAGNITFYAIWRTASYTEAKFSCAELTLTPHLVTANTPIFITSTAEKTVRSQDYIEITGNGLTPSTELTFPGLPSKFAIKNADGTAISTDGSGEVSANAYIFYNPGATTEDGLDELTGITVSVGGAKPKQVSLTQSIIGRHLPADFVIAGKVGNKWYALPADFSEESTPDPIEIAVNDINNPSLAYTASTNIYNLYGQNSGASGFLYNDGDSDGNPDGDKIKLGMKNNSNKPLFAFASPKNSLKGDGTATVTNNINKQYWWTLRQTNTTINISNAQDAKYKLISSNNSGTLSIKNSPFVWGTYASGVEELRLIPASNIPSTEAYFVEWGQHGGVIEVDAGATGINATSVVAHLGAASGSATLTNAGTAKKPGTTTKYNYIVDFGNDIDFAAAASNGALLTLEWKNGETVKAMTSLVVPKIIAEDGVMSEIASGDAAWSSAEVHVLPGVTLEADAYGFGGDYAVTIDQLEIYPGATVKVTTGTLDVRKLILRNGWKRVGGTDYNTARLHIATTANLTKTNNTDPWYSDWYIDFDQYYPIAVPWPTTVSGWTYKNSRTTIAVGPSSTSTNNVRLRYYDGNSRATNIQEGVGSGANWKQYGEAGNTAVPATLEPSKAYAMTAKRPTGKSFSIVRMPLTFANAWGALGEQGSVDATHKDQVAVTAHGVHAESQTAYAEGWNFIANPYMAIYQGTLTLTPAEGDATTVNVVNIPDVDFKEYGQYATATAKLKPSSGFLIQAPITGTVTFGTANRKISAPSYRQEVQDVTRPEQQAYILLSNENAEDMMGIFVSDKYTAGYDLNGDVEKFLSDGTSLRTYMHYGNMNMAYVAINEVLAREWIPVNVRIPNSGEYTFSMHEASIAGELEGVYLIDYSAGGTTTNLIEQSYTFAATAGSISGRFAINAIVGEHSVPTAIDAVSAGADLNSDKPFKFIWHDKVFILHQGVIYDATGKRVREINK